MSSNTRKQDEFTLAVMNELMKMHDLPAVATLQAGKNVICTLIRQRYDTYSEYNRDLDKAIDIVQCISSVGSMRAFAPNQHGILRLRKNLDLSEHPNSDDKAQKQRHEYVKQWANAAFNPVNPVVKIKSMNFDK